MRMKKNYLLREIADMYVVVPTGQEAIKFNGIISLNQSGKRLFEKLQEDRTESELVDFLLDTYDVTKKKAREDIRQFVAILKEHDLLDETD